MSISRVAALLVLLSIACALISNILNAQVMGKARLGVSIIAPEENSPEWNNKVTKLWWADALAYVGIGFAVLSAVLTLFSPRRQLRGSYGVVNRT